jgi:hypothetical protein
MLKMKLAFALVASVAGDIIRGPSVTYDTYIRGGSGSNTNYNSETLVLWDGPFSPVSSDTKAALIRFDLSSLVGATLVPASPVWFYYRVADEGNPGSLRELTVSWNHVCTTHAKTHAPLTTACGTLAETPSRGRVPLCPSLRSAGHSHVDQPPIRNVIVERHQRRSRPRSSYEQWLE